MQLRRTKMAKEITRGALAEAILSKDPPIVLEALARKYYAAGHIPSAQALPPDELAKLVPELVPDMARGIVVYCASDTCANSHQAAAWLTERGYSNVAVYPGGKKDWIEAGLKLER
jgi:rhodanese-related sulfurtransferase